MNKLALYLLVCLLSAVALAADYASSPEIDRQAIENWRTLRGSACAPCGAPCQGSSGAEEM